MIRMKFVAHFYYSVDIVCMRSPFPTQVTTHIIGDDYGIAILSMIELSLSIICVCFPAVKLLIDKYFPTEHEASGAVLSIASLQMSGSTGPSNSQPKSVIRTAQSKLSFLFARSQTSVAHPWHDEETPPVTGLAHRPGLSQDKITFPNNIIHPPCN